MDKILELFINEPLREFHIREISKILKKSPTTISKYLKDYKKIGLLLSEDKLNHILFKANLKNKEFKEIKRNYNLNKLNKSGVINHLIDKFNFPEAIILFGSFAKAENIKRSDIDLLVISPLKKEINLGKFGKKLGHKIQLFVYSSKDIKKMKQNNKELLNNLINGRVIYGYWEIFK